MEFAPTYRRIFRTDEERQDDLDLILELKAKQWTWAEITDHLNDRGLEYVVTQREIRQQYHLFLKENTSIIDRELEQMSILDELYRVYQLAYEAYLGSLKSKAELRTHTRPDIGQHEEILKKIKIQKEGKGSSAYLNVMLKVLEQRAKLLNLTEDLIFNVTTAPVVKTPHIEAPISSEERLLEMYNKIK